MTLPRHRRPLGGFVFAAALALAALGCGKKFDNRPLHRELGSPKVNFQEHPLSMLGRPEGPYVFIKCLSPTLIELSSSRVKGEVFRLIGLSDHPFPEPGPVAVPGQPTPSPTPAEAPAARDRRLNEIKAFKMESIKNACGLSQLYVIRMTRQTPAMVYLVIPDKTILPDQPARGSATLINAQLLRKGMANLELSLQGSLDHPFFEQMLDCQLAGYLDAQRKKSGGVELWTRFGMPLPKDPCQDRLAEIKNSL